MELFFIKCQVCDIIMCMTATGHAVIGTVIAAKIGNPYLAVPIALVSHILADIFPHWDTATNVDKKGKKRVIAETFFDIAIGFFVSYVLLFSLFPKTNPLYALFIIFVSQSFDWLTAPYYFFKINIPPFTWAYHLQKKFDNELDKPWGIINQIVILILVVALAKIF